MHMSVAYPGGSICQSGIKNLNLVIGSSIARNWFIQRFVFVYFTRISHPLLINLHNRPQKEAIFSKVCHICPSKWINILLWLAHFFYFANYGHKISGKLRKGDIMVKGHNLVRGCQGSGCPLPPFSDTFARLTFTNVDSSKFGQIFSCFFRFSAKKKIPTEAIWKDSSASGRGGGVPTRPEVLNVLPRNLRLVKSEGWFSNEACESACLRGLKSPRQKRSADTGDSVSYAPV